MKDTIRIVIAEHDSVVRDGLRGLLSLEPDFDVIGMVGDGGKAIETVENFA